MKCSTRNSDRFSYLNCFVFADYSIGIWHYAVELTQEVGVTGAVFLIDGEYSRMMCDSVREFMSNYAEDDMKIVN